MRFGVIVVKAGVFLFVALAVLVGSNGVGSIQFSSIASEGTGQEANRDVVAAHIKAGDELAKHPKTVENLEKAVKQYEQALELDANNLKALCKIADAYICIIDIRVDGLIVETEENKEVLKTLGQKALDYAEQAYAINPKSLEATTVNLQAYAYASAGFGIIQAVLKGAAGHYKDLAKEILEIDDQYRGGLAYRYLGRLYYVSPWPVGSAKKAKKNYMKAAEISSERIEPHYWLGMIYLDDKAYDLAKKEFQWVVVNPPHISEEHWIAEFKNDSKRKLALIAEKQK
jgi:tetratricopeptide (TPR) repeat protein